MKEKILNLFRRHKHYTRQLKSDGSFYPPLPPLSQGDSVTIDPSELLLANLPPHMKTGPEE
jgi:hypothetical protein